MSAEALIISVGVTIAGLSAGSAIAANPVPIYGGGAQNHTPLLRAWGDCAGTPITGQTIDTHCSNPGVFSTYEYLWAGVNAGQGLIALLQETSPDASVVPSVSPYQDTARGFTYPYAKWDLTDSDAPLDSPSPINSNLTVLQDYQNTVFNDGFTDAQKRGLAWQYPFAVTPIDVIFNKTNFDNLQFTPASGDGEEVKLQLRRDAICFIYTKRNAAGTAVAGAYDWSNAIFNSANNSKSLLKKGEKLAIVAYHRPDAAGQTYLFALYLQHTCKGYAAAGYSDPATTITWPTFTTAAPQTGSSGIVKSVVAQVGSIAYVGPSNAEPVLQPGAGVTTAPSAYMQTTFSAVQFVAPSVTAVLAGMANVPPPGAGVTAATWGAALDKKFFRASASGAYPIVGLSYFMGYQCYGNQATITGIQDLFRFYTQTPTGGNTTAEADQMLASKGFVSLAYDTATNGAGQTFGQAVYAAITSGANRLRLVPKTAPAVCPKYHSDTHGS